MAIALGALVVRVLVIVLVDPHVPPLGDATAYHLLANHLADGRGYIRPFDLVKFDLVVPTAEYPPLHPFVLSLFARAGMRSVEAQRLGLAVVGSGTVALVGLLGRRDRGHRGRARRGRTRGDLADDVPARGDAHERDACSSSS